MKIYAIVDIKAKTIASIFTSVNNDTAIRSFLNLINVPEDTLFNQCPQDFSLYYLCDVVFKNSPVIFGPGFDNVESSDLSYRLVPKIDCCEEVFAGSSLSPDVIMSNRIKAAEKRKAIYSAMHGEKGDLDEKK